MESDSSLSSIDEYFDHAVLKHLGQEKKVKNISDFQKTVVIKINGADVRAEPDSGADISLMDEQKFKALLNRSERKPILKSSEIRLSTQQHELPVIGEFTTAISNKKRSQALSLSEDE